MDTPLADNCDVAQGVTTVEPFAVTRFDLLR